MFDRNLETPDEVLMQQLRMFAQTGAMRSIDAIINELWRRDISKQQYLDWLKAKMDKERS